VFVSQFRTTADILDEILQKAGEETNGNSPFETLARTYANKVHHAIIGGGSIFNLKVDEPWVWARSKKPIVLELQPAYTTGAVSCTVNDTAIVFTMAPASSLEGWHFQISGKSTVYKIVQHNAGEVTACLDSSFVDDSGAFSFRAFKLDYEILPVYAYVDSFNDTMDFQEGTAFTTRTASFTHGAYTLSGLIAHIAARMDTAATASVSGGFDTVLKQYSVTCSSSFKMLGSTGANAKRSVLPSIGFDRIDHTAAQVYTSTYIPNGIARLIEPFKLFTGEVGNPMIYSTDPIKMQQDYPVSLTRERTPDRFVRLTEDNDGTVWVRFNCYPRYKTKIQMDWIPQPIDLQDNTVSTVLLPRGDVDTLIHGACAFIAFDKSDNKFQNFMSLTEAGLEAMKKKNHGALFRTGENFGQIVPRTDYYNPRQRLNYGYTSGSAVAGSTASATNVLTSVTIPYTSFQTSGTVNTVLARTLPASRSLFSIIAKHSTNFTGALISAITLDVGITGDATYFINGFDIGQAVSGTAQASFVGLYYPAVETGIYVRATSTGANLSALAQGNLILYLQENIVP
jgi:hypothetical protein